MKFVSSLTKKATIAFVALQALLFILAATNATAYAASKGRL